MKLKLKHNPSLIIGIVITGVILLIAIVGLFWTPYSTTKMSPELKFAPPSIAHWFGCLPGTGAAGWMKLSCVSTT